VAEDRAERRLTTILAADVVGYSRLMAADEAGTLTSLKAIRRELIEPKTAEYRGRVVKLMGDGTLMEFGSVVDAVTFAVDVQQALAERNAKVPEDRRITYRMGINIGDVIVEGDDIYGDGVNVAARLEAMADPGRICVARNVYNQVKTKAEVGFEDLGEQKVKNIPEPVQVFRVLLPSPTAEPTAAPAPAAKRSLRWLVAAGGLAVLVAVAGVVLWQRPWQPREEPASVEAMAFPLPDRPSIAVLPFNNMSDDAGQDYFTDGMTEDLITDLSKISGLFVIARNSSFSYKGQQVKVRQVAEEMGVRYVLEGSVRRAGDQVRINAQLIDATTGGHIWAERYDGSMADVFALQDKVTGQIVAALAVSLTADEQAIRTETETETAPAYDAFLQGWELYRLGTAEDWAVAIPFLEKAIKLDPYYCRAYAALAAIYWNSARNSWTRSLGLTWNEALEKTRLNLRQAMNNPSTLAHQVASERAAYLQRTAGKAIDQADLAIALDTNDPAGYLAMANALIKAGKSDEAVELVRQAMRLDPHFPASYLTRLGRAQFAMGDYEGAAATFDRAAGRNPENDWTFVYLAAAYGHLGNQQDAKIAVEAANALRAQRGWSTLTLENVDKERAYGERVAVLPERKSLREGLGQAGVAAGTGWMALVKTAPAGFEVEGAATIDAEAAKALHGQGVNFVDVRRHALWSRGRIPGAHNLFVLDGFDEAPLLEIVSKAEEVVIHGHEDDRDMAAAAAKAVVWGFQKVYYLDDGFDGWKNAGYPVEKNN
jgi:TolB-like protein/class 3 adenylate cyclase/rhodanese-related sulfurtransferase/Flp pilus assembly protein TadD